MANLVRLCVSHSNEFYKPLLKYKFGYELYKIYKIENKIGNERYHLTKIKAFKNSKKCLTWKAKIYVGIVTSVTVKIFQKNFVFCLKENNTRLAHNVVSKNEPEFNWSKFFIYLQGYWLELIGAIIAAIICALLNIQIPRTLGSIVNILSKLSNEEQILSDLRKPGITIVVYYALQSLFTFFYIALLAHIGEGIAQTMKVQMFSSIMNQDISFFDFHRSGEILNRLTVDIQDFKSSFKMVISQGLRNITQIIGCSISLFFISPTMTSIMIIIVPAGILCGTYVGSLLRHLSFKAKEQNSNITLVAEEAVSNIRTVRSFAMEELENKIFYEQANICKKLNIKLGYGIALFQAGTNFFLNGMVLSTIYLGGYMMTLGSISAGDLMAFLVAVQILQRSFTQISLLFGVYIKGKHAGARVFEMIDLVPGKTLGGEKKIPYESLVPNVEFKDVTFTYPSRRDKEVLKGINLFIPEGKTVAIVGSSGSGKSTLAWLLERFYDIENGAILIGEEDIKNLDSSWLRKNVIGFISQEPVLFATSVLENIRYGKPSATDEEVIAAAKLANADEFIKEFPASYNTMVGERGVSVSGGQKQRIAIARALLKNPSILILDEATSALDSESEKALKYSLDVVTKSRTTIIIAHRLSTIKNADLIVVLHNGKIIESGTHRELLAKNGMYAALISHQMENN